MLTIMQRQGMLVNVVQKDWYSAQLMLTIMQRQGMLVNVVQKEPTAKVIMKSESMVKS